MQTALLLGLVPLVALVSPVAAQTTDSNYNMALWGVILGSIALAFGLGIALYFMHRAWCRKGRNSRGSRESSVEDGQDMEEIEEEDNDDEDDDDGAGEETYARVPVETTKSKTPKVTTAAAIQQQRYAVL